MSTTPSGTGGDVKDQLGLTLNPEQQVGGNQNGMGTLGVGSTSKEDKKKPFGPSDFITIMRAYLDNARAEIKAKERELKDKAAFRKMERTVGLKSKQREAEEAFNDLSEAYGGLHRVEGKVKELKKELEKWEIKLEVEREVHGHSYYQKDVDKAQSKLNEVMPEYNAAKAQVEGATRNYHETHDTLEQAFRDMAEMEKEYRGEQLLNSDAERASIPKAQGN